MTRVKVLLTVCLILVLVSGCDAVQKVLPGVVPSPVAAVSPPAVHEITSKSIVAIQQSLTLAERIALEYVKLPRCGKTSARICSDPNIVRQIADADDQAYNAVMAARRNQGSLEFAWQMVENFKRIIPSR